MNLDKDTILMLLTIAIYFGGMILGANKKRKRNRNKAATPAQPIASVVNSVQLHKTVRPASVAKVTEAPVYEFVPENEGEHITDEPAGKNKAMPAAVIDQDVARRRRKLRRAIIMGEILAPKFRF